MNGETLFQVARADRDWEPLGDVCRRGGGDIQTGPFGSQLHASDYVQVGVPSIMPQNISQDRVDADGIARITPSDAERLTRYLVKPGDIVYSRRGDVARRALITEKEDGWLCGTGCLRVRFGDGVVDPVYASYFLSHPASREWVVRHAVGATMPNLNTSILGALPFLLPSLPDQHAIAAVLGALDDKIEQNRRTAQALEKLAQAIFRAWFVDFEPVKAKAAGAASFPSMPQEVFDALPTRFTDSEIGPVPEGWEAVSLDSIASVGSGKRPTGRSDTPTPECNIPLYGGGGQMGYVPQPLYENPILFTGRVGTLGLIFRTTDPSWPSDNTLVVEPLSVFFDFVYFTLKEFDLIALNRGSTQPLLTQTDLKHQQFAMPNETIVESFASTTSALFRKIDADCWETRKLAEMRDYLLPKLLSGDVQISVTTGEGEEP